MNWIKINKRRIQINSIVSYEPVVTLTGNRPDANPDDPQPPVNVDSYALWIDTTGQSHTIQLETEQALRRIIRRLDNLLEPEDRED